MNNNFKRFNDASYCIGDVVITRNMQSLNLERLKNKGIKKIILIQYSGGEIADEIYILESSGNFLKVKTHV